MKALEVLEHAKKIQIAKGNDYQNKHSRVNQADYYPRGLSTILDTMLRKVLRMQSVLEGMEYDKDYKPNFESLEDSAIDLINYSTFFVAYMHGELQGQDKDRDFLNRKK